MTEAIASTSSTIKNRWDSIIYSKFSNLIQKNSDISLISNEKIFTTNDTNYNPTTNFSPNIFTYTKWMGDFDGQNNTPQAVIWSDQSSLYYSNDGDFTSVTVSTTTGSTTTQTFVEPLTQSTEYNTQVDCATTVNIDLSQPITGANSTIDGYTLSQTSLILVKNQNDPTENGIYFVTNANYLLINTAYESPQYVFVKYGDTQSNTEWSELTQTTDLRKGRNFALRYWNVSIYQPPKRS